MKLQMIGGGKMAEALLGGLVECGWATAEELHVVEPVAERRAALGAVHPSMSIGTEPFRQTDAVIAVKPDVVAAVLPGLTDAGVARVLSIAAGVRTEAIEAQLPAGARVVRAMPNTPALVGKGAAAIAAGAAAQPDDLEWARGILAAVGTVEIVDESDLDAVTGLSGSGPAYVFCFAEALRAAGIGQGLAPEVADALTRQTLLGAAVLLSDSGEDPAVLRSNVTSPGGTTAAGLAVFAEADLVELVHRVVRAAADRSRELGR
ncbi:MAG: pyrroline-5-carboxylate reductase [Acidimicrobiaceae bacterium]|nr:pyrroline-5-carboxylate reductase [Acidimicrobiaceae bacterium]